MKKIQRIFWYMVVLGCFAFFLFYGQGNGQGIDQDSNCISCHEKVVNIDTKYTHIPFLQKNCSVCHLSSEEPLPDDMNHENRLRTRDEIGIDICYSQGCHPKEKLGVSHPVGIYPSYEITIPDILPTGTGGKLLCITCHAPHGSDEEYMGRKPVSDQLCIACHGRGYFE